MLNLSNKGLPKYNELTAISLIIGTVIGAGILGLPIVFSEAGFWAGMLNLIIIGSASTLMMLYVAELSMRTRKKHQLAGFAMKYLGNNWKYIMLVIETLGIYAVLIAYLTGVGNALSNLFGGSTVIWSTVFFVVISPFVYFGLKAISSTELLVTTAKMILLTGIIIVVLPGINVSNYATHLSISTIFIPFGVVLFATLGYTIVPEIEEIMKHDKSRIKDIIVFSMAIVIAIYALFAFAFVGVFGKEVNELATLSLTGKLAVFGDIFLLLTMTTPFIALCAVVKDIYNDDFGIDKKVAWFLAAFISFMLFLYLDLDFITLIGVAGTYAFGVMGIVTLFMVINARKQVAETRPEFIVPGGSFTIYITMLIFLLGIVYHTAVLAGLI